MVNQDDARSEKDFRHSQSALGSGNRLEFASSQGFRKSPMEDESNEFESSQSSARSASAAEDQSAPSQKKSDKESSKASSVKPPVVLNRRQRMELFFKQAHDDTERERELEREREK